VAAVAEQATWLLWNLRWRLMITRLRWEVAEQVALQVLAAVLVTSPDSRTGLQSISACLEVAVGQAKGMLLETEGVAAAGLLEQKVQVELLELELRRV
jgi:hypothetical protein